MRILFWIPYPTEGASNRYRVEQYLPYLKQAGISYSLRPFWQSSVFKILYKKGHHFEKISYFVIGTLSRIWDIICIFKYDIVFVHREAYPIGGAFFERLLRLLKRPLIFDFDDAIFLPASSRTNNFVERFKRPEKIAEIIRISQHVIAGNDYLAKFSLSYNKAVSIIPTALDTNKYKPGIKEQRGDVIIGWMGSVTTLGFLDMMKNVFIRLSDKFSRIEFKIVGGKFSVAGLNNVISKEWKLEEEPEVLRTFDIGIMPMPDDIWTKAKCGFKAILYMSMGIPCVCSAVGVNKEIIVDGINGFLVNNEDEWVQKVSLLIKDRQLRQRIGLAGRKTIEEKYSLKVNAPMFLKVMKKFYNKK